MFVWKFIVPLSIFVIAFSKILAVIRHQAKVMPSNRRKITVKPADAISVAPTKSATTYIGSIFNLSQRENDGEARNQCKVENKGVSQTQINIIKTMMFIVSCFTVCWLPKTVDLMYMKLVVS